MSWRNLGVCIVLGAVVLLYLSHKESPIQNEHVDTSSLASLVVPKLQFGYNPDSFHIEEFAIAPGAVVGELLTNAGVPYASIHQLVELATGNYSVRRIRAGKTCALVRNPETCKVECFVYEPNPYSFVKYHVGEKVDVEVVEREVEYCVESASGVITSSLWGAMDGAGHTDELIDMMADALAWAVDFHHVQKNDEFRLVYEQKYVEEKPVGIGKLLGAYYKSGNAEHYSIWFDSGNYSGYYDQNGRTVKRAFLKAPVKYSRISSRFSNSRFHPVLKRYKGHYGTDYAAPYGTPIVAVADGTVSKASYTSGNGNYVKIRHDDVYETQYLHMQKFASGIRPGTRVKHNQGIGYVGSTGLATGPHVCFRFWKNGKQVDHFRENLPPPQPMPAKDFPAYERVKAGVMPLLDEIQPAVTSSPTP
jgi:murein DD-endopeptidase MepM/ murein hydrolase activator NlpD